MDGWIDIRKHPLANIIVTYVASPFFLRAINFSRKSNDANFHIELLMDVIENVGITNVVYAKQCILWRGY